MKPSCTLCTLYNFRVYHHCIPCLLLSSSQCYGYYSTINSHSLTIDIAQKYISWCGGRVILGVVAEWSKVLTPVPWPFMVWSTLALGTFNLRFVSWVFHIIFSFVHFISLYTLGGLRAFRKPLPYNMYLFNLLIENHILIISFLILTNSPVFGTWFNAINLHVHSIAFTTLV